MKILDVALEGGKSSQVSLFLYLIRFCFLLSIDSHTLERVACVQLADARLTLISLFQSKSALKSAMLGVGGA